MLLVVSQHASDVMSRDINQPVKNKRKTKTTINQAMKATPGEKNKNIDAPGCYTQELYSKFPY